MGHGASSQPTPHPPTHAEVEEARRLVVDGVKGSKQSVDSPKKCQSTESVSTRAESSPRESDFSPRESGLAARRPGMNLRIDTKTSGTEEKAVSKTKKRAIAKCSDIAEHYKLGKEVMPSSNPGMEVRFGTKVSNGEEVVIKTRVKKDSFMGKQDEESWIKSTERLLNLPKSENIAQLQDVMDDGKTYYIVMEKADGMDLFEALSSDGLMDMDTIKDVLRQLLLGMKDLHARGFVHRDIKLENVVVDRSSESPKASPESTPCAAAPKMRQRRPSVCSVSSMDSMNSMASVKVIDFDTVETYSPKNKASEVVGTDQYIAREAYLGHYSPASDVFAVGVIGYKLITGRFPFKRDTFDDEPGENWVGSPKMKEISDRLQSYKVDFKRAPFPQEPAARKLIESMLKPDEHDRPTAEQALDHEFLVGLS